MTVNVVDFVEADGNVYLVTEYAGTSTLHDLLVAGPLPQRRAWDIMRGLMSALDELHSHSIVHGDIHSANIVVNPDTNDLRLIDLGFAFFSGRSAIDHAIGANEGLIGYLAPEKSGRTSHQVDHRSDLYSAGVVFFEILTGRKPFESTDTLEILHAQIAERPPRVSELDTSVPPSTSDLIDLLLQKDPENRYQSAYGVLADLTILEEAPPGKQVELRTRDVNERFAKRSGLIGRDQELEVLRRHLVDVTSGFNTLGLIDGPAGVGKSALIARVMEEASRLGILVAKGWCDRTADLPLSGIAALADHVTRTILRQPDEAVSNWKQQVEERVGSTLATLIPFVPLLSTVFDVDPDDVQQVGAGDARRRLMTSFVSYLEVSTNLQPTLLVIEDLHWADEDTIDVLRQLSQPAEGYSFAMLGTRRTSDVTINVAAAARTMRLLESVPNSFVLELANLDDVAVRLLIASSFSLSAADLESLVSNVLRTTNGSPLLVEQYLGLLVDQGVLVFDRSDHRWQYHPTSELIDASGDQLESVLRQRFSTIDHYSQRILATLATIGTRIELVDLLALTDDPDRVRTAISKAVAHGLVTSLLDDSKLHYSFVHDRLRTYAESLFTADERSQVHVRYARILLEDPATPSLSGKALFRVADQLVRTPFEKLSQTFAVQVVELMDMAAEAAKRAGALNVAITYSETASKISSSLDHRPSAVAFDRSLLLAECLGNVGEYDRAHAELDLVEPLASTDFDHARVHRLRVILYNLKTLYLESIRHGREALMRVGVHLAESPSPLTVVRTLARVWNRQRRLTVDEIERRPHATDPAVLLAMDVLQNLQAPAYNLNENVFACVLLERADLVFRHGHAHASVDAYTSYGVFLRTIGATATAEVYGDLALQLSRSSRDLRAKAYTQFTDNTIIYPWVHVTSDVIHGLHESVQLAEQSGDTDILAYSCGVYAQALLYAGGDVRGLFEEIEECLTKIDRAWQRSDHAPTFATYYHVGILTVLTTLAPALELGDRSARLLEQADDIEQDVLDSGNTTAICLIHLMHAYSAMLRGDHDTLRSRLRAIAPHQRGMLAQTMSMQYEYLLAISAGWSLFKGHSLSRSDVRQLRRSLKRFRSWERHQHENFHARRLIVEALLSGANGRPDDLTHRLEQAVGAAKRVGNRLLALEASMLVARLDDGWKSTATDLAVDLGADGVIPVIQGKRIDLAGLSAAVPRSPIASSSVLDSAQLEVASIAKASTAIATEIDAASLHKRLLSILVENAGASHAFIAIPSPDGMLVVAQYGYKVDTGHADGIDLASYQECCHPMLREALRTRLPVSVDNAQISDYRDDAHVSATGVRSIMAFPVVYQGSVACVFYLENLSLTGAFTTERERFLGLLAGQIAVSLENARLYKEQASTLRAAERFIPQEFLDALGIASIRDVQLGDAVNVPMTVLFADIRRFTSLSERMSVRGAFEFLNEYLEAVTPAIRNHHGFIDKYIGDAVMALFPRDPSHAVRAALEIMDEVRRLNQRLGASLDGPLEIGIGIHVGEVMLGTVGAEHRMDTTVIGDTVNIAARLEELTKTSSVPIILSDDVLQRLPAGLVSTVELGMESIRGRSTAIKIHGISIR